MKTTCFRLMTSGRQAARGIPMLWRWRRAALKRTSCFSVVLLLGFLLAPALAFGQAAGPPSGANDPMGGPNGYTLLRDDELFVLRLPPTGPGEADSFNTYEIGANFQGTQAAYVNDSSFSTESQQLFAASGRPLQPDKDHVVVAQRSGTSDVVLRFFQGFGEQNYTLPNANLAPRTPPAPSSDFLDVAVGDLDHVVDSDGNFHDEVVVAWAALDVVIGQYVPNIAVLDYTTPAATATPIAVTSAVVPVAIDVSNVTSADNALSVALGDFDGDGQNEIALASLVDSGSISLSILRYLNDGAGSRSFQAIAPVDVAPDPSGWYFIASVDVAAANLDGDPGNKDELLLGGVVSQHANVSSGTAYRPHMWVLTAGANLVLSTQSSIDVRGDLSDDGLVDDRPRIQLVPGLFLYDPESGFDINRHQVAAFSSGNEGLNATVYSVSTDLATIDSEWTYTPPAPPSGQQTGQRWAAMAGGLLGNTDPDDPRWWLAVASQAENNSNAAYGVYGSIGSGSSVTLISWSPAVIPNPNLRPAIVAYDWDGDSTILGAAARIEASGLPRTDYMLQEPPKHTYYDEANEVVQDLTRFDNFFVSLQDDAQRNFSFSNTQQSGYNVGADAELSAYGTAKVGKDKGIFAATGTFTGDLTAKLAYGYQRNQSSVNSGYATADRSIAGTTAIGDWAQGQVQLYDIWRYRIYGTSYTDESASNAFYEITVPGPTLPFSGDPLQFDWYQPIHENGNILSYVQQLNPDLSNRFTPEDVGAFDYTDPTGAEFDDVQGILSSASLWLTDNSATTGTLSFDGAATSGSTVSYSNSLTGSADLNVSATAKVKVPGLKLTGGLRGGLGFNGGYSWGGVDTGQNTTTLSTGITLQRPDFDNTTAYGFYPVFYVTQDGTTKVVHAIDVLKSSTGRIFWEDTYAGNPDAAVNLPLRFSPSYDSQTNALTGWKPNPLSSRKQMRGFFVTEPDVSPITGDYFVLPGGATDGDTVRIAARVYNYTTPTSGKGLDGLEVSFYAVQYDAGSDQEVGSRIPIGSTRASIEPQGNTLAEILWDTTGFGPPNVGIQAYRVYVVLDEDNAISETYETEPANCTFASVSDPDPAAPCNPGQNNEGWGVTAVASAPDDASLELADEPDISLHAKSLAALAKNGKLYTRKFSARINETVRLRVAVHSDQHHPFARWVLVYDGVPGEGVETIAMKRLLGIEENRDGHVWIDWNPRTPGKHDLNAVVLEERDDRVPGNNVASLEVQVPGPKQKK